MIRSLLILVFCAAFIGVGVNDGDAKIYSWKDAAGVIHYTDNKANVPHAQRNRAEVGKLQELVVVDGDSKSVVAATTGRGLFAKRCGECHVAAYEDRGEKLALLGRAIDRRTKMVLKDSELAAVLKRAADGRYSDMPGMDISQDDLLMIARFLISKAKRGK
ncbi:MAG: DUF4124 domain-containing protein [Mariprofundaceae bacterium]